MSIFNLLGAVAGGAFGLSAANRAAGASTQAANTARQTALETQERGIEFSREQTERAIDLFEQARDRGLEALDEGTVRALEALGIGRDEASEIYRGQFAQAQPALAETRRVAGLDPTILTPDQEIALEDSRREAMTAIDNSQLRGAGRAGQAIIADMDRRARADAFNQNLARKDRARELLTPQAFAAQDREAALQTALAGDVASIESSRGANEANIEGGFGANAGGQVSQLGSTGTSAIRGAGDSAVRSITNAGNTSANAALARGQILGNSVGQGIAALERFFDGDDDESRDSRFASFFGA